MDPSPDNKSLDLEAIAGAFKAIINESESSTLRLCKLDASCDQILFRLRAQGASEPAAIAPESEAYRKMMSHMSSTPPQGSLFKPSEPAGPALTPQEAEHMVGSFETAKENSWPPLKYGADGSLSAARARLITALTGQADQPGKDGTK